MTPILKSFGTRSTRNRCRASTPLSRAWRGGKLNGTSTSSDQGRHDYAIADVHELLVEHRGRGRGSGVKVEARFYNVYTVHGGKVVCMDEFTTRVEAFEAVGLSE